MSDTNASGKTLKFVPILKGSDAISLHMRESRFVLYKFLLFVQDFIAVALGFYLAAEISGVAVYLGNYRDLLLFTVLSFVVLGFFPASKLYSYHHILSRRRHLMILAKAFVLSIISLGLIVFVYTYKISLEGKSAFFIVAFASIFILIVSRFFWAHILDIARAFGLSFIAIGIIAFLYPEGPPLVILNRAVIPVGFCLAVVINILCRSMLVQFVFNKALRRHFRRQIAIVGSGTEAEEITSHIIKIDAPFYVQGIICDQEEECLNSTVTKERLGDLKNLPKIVENKNVNEIIVTDEKINQRVLIALLDYCTSEGLTIWFPPRLLPIIDMKLYIDNFCGLPMIRLCSQKNTWIFNKLKHSLDAIIGLPIFLLLLPFFIILGIIIKINSKGPVFYRAKAIGKNGENFTMYKFRSMRTDMDSDKHKEFVTKMIKGEMDYEGKKDKVFKMTDDPRITSVGKFIRKFSIDELPQIINVLKGDMSLVGPRPCLPYEFEAYEDWHKKRLSVRPGISGLWQVAGRSAVTFEDMIILDLYYIYNRSLLMDMSILYETIYTVLGKKGAF